jgi:branched-chain amino acid transport system substrate-binding protein
VENYEKKYGEIGPYSVYAYDAANILLTAVREAGSSEGRAVMDKLHSMEFSGALGKTRFDDKGDVTGSPYVVWITKDGKFIEFWRP